MPAFTPPADSNLPEPPASSWRRALLVSSHTHIALCAVAAVLVAICLRSTLSARLKRGRKGPYTGSTSFSQYSEAPARPPNIGPFEKLLQPYEPRNFGEKLQTFCQTGPQATPVAPSLTGPGPVASHDMDSPGNGRSRSRGVSIGAPDAAQPPSAHGFQLSRRSSRPPRPPSSSPAKRYSTISVGSAGPECEETIELEGLLVASQPSGVDEGNTTGRHPEGVSRADSSMGYAALENFSRPPPPLPLTQPTLASTVMAFEVRRPAYAASIAPQRNEAFIHQPNPDYMAASTSADLSSSPESPTAVPRRRSYTKTVPVGIPFSPESSSSSGSHDNSAPSEAVSPSSYPPTSPQLPPPPPGYFNDAVSEYDVQPQEIGLQGEIISVMDDAGHGWKRHTRVYGGGVCLACLAAQDQGASLETRCPWKNGNGDFKSC